MSENVYWAAESSENIGSKIIDKFKAYRRYMSDTGEIQKLRKSYKAFYGDTQIRDVGKGLKHIHVNNYASLSRNLHVMITSQRPALDCRAINTDLESQASTELGEGLLDYYMREKHLESKFTRTVELAINLKEGWICFDWDVNAGEPLATTAGDNEIDEQGNIIPPTTIFEGDISAQVYHLLDVARDIYKKDLSSHKWYIIKEYRNKFDLAATYKNLEADILSIPGESKEDIEYELNPLEVKADHYTESDLIPIYKLYHDKTPALPEGRLVLVADKDLVLFDGPLPYRRPYVFPMTATTKVDSSYGHTFMDDLLSLQDALDLTFSAILTNNAANAVQNFQMPKGGGIKSTMAADGMRILEFDPKLGPIQPLDLLKTAPEVYNFTEMINNYMQLLSNISPISRGEAPASMSGAAMALLQQQSIQFNNGLQLNYAQLLENGGTAIIELLQDFAIEERVALIVGKNKNALMKYFSGEDLKGISRVVVDSANPLTKTTAGRVEIANQLLARPDFIKTPEQYLGVLTTGNLEPLYEFDRSRQHLVKAENEALLNGQPVQAVLTDDHAIHALEHSCIANNLEVRKNPEILLNVLNHIQEHMNMAQQMSPQMAAMLRQTSFAPSPAPPPVNPQMMNQTPTEQQATSVNMPKPAESPLPPMQ